MENIKPEDITYYHFINKYTKPLSYFELNSVAIEREKTLNLSLEGLLTQDISTPSPKFENVKVDLPITFNKEIQIFSLVDGGWLPLPFVNPPHFLVDSNVIINLEKLMKNLPINTENASWWLQLLNGSDVIINPILYAFEGKQMTTPKFSDFVDCLEDSEKTIQNVLPNAKIVKFTSEIHAKVYEVVKNSVKKIESHIKFLKRVNSLICNHVSKRELSNVELEIIKIAKELKINLMSLTVLVVLSCLYEINNNSNYPAARKILKLSPNFNENKAYNALYDLFAIEMYVGTGVVSKQTEFKFAFCTSDKSIALFGCGLNLKNKSFGANGLTFTVSITKELFPILDDNGRLELMNRLSN